MSNVVLRIAGNELTPVDIQNDFTDIPNPLSRAPPQTTIRPGNSLFL